MFCKDCGAQLSADSRFCPRCGSAQAVTPPPQPAAPLSFADKVRYTAQKACASPLILTIAICCTLIQLLNVLSLGSVGSVFNVFAAYFAQVGVTIPNLSTPLLILSGIGLLPGILIVIGIWITYGSCTGNKPKVNTTGLTMIFVVNLVQMTLICLSLLAALFPLILVYAGAEELFMAYEDIAEALVMIVGLVLLAVFAFTLIYYIKFCTSITNVRSTLQTGVPNKKVSRFIGVMCYVSGAIMILSGISNLFDASALALGQLYMQTAPVGITTATLLSAVTTLLSATVQILLGVWIFSYRNKMETLEAEERLNTFQTLSHAEPYTSPVYVPPQAEEILEPVEVFEPEDFAEAEEAAASATEEVN